MRSRDSVCLSVDPSPYPLEIYYKNILTMLPPCTVIFHRMSWWLPSTCLLLISLLMIYYIQRKIFFRWSIFLYSLCPGGHKWCALLQVQETHDWSELCRVHKQVCQGLGTIEMHSRAWARGSSAAHFNRPARQATKPRAKWEVTSVLCYGLVVDSTFERSDVAITVSLSSYSRPAVSGVVFICACALY